MTNNTITPNNQCEIETYLLTINSLAALYTSLNFGLVLKMYEGCISLSSNLLEA